MRTALLAAAIALALAANTAAAGSASPARAASEAETHAIAVAVRQPRWSCFGGRIARRGGWGALLRLRGGGCPDLPYAILVREDRTAGWRELRRFGTRRAACGARRPRLSGPLRAGLLRCGGTGPSAARGYSADSSHQ